MSFTYTFPIATDVHRVRLRIQDTNSADYLIEDEEIEYYLEEFGSITRAVIQICYALAFKLSSKNYEEFQVDDIKVKSGQNMANRFLDLAKSLEKSIELGIEVDEIPNIHFGGVYQSDIDNNKQQQNDDYIVKNPFNKDILDTINNYDDDDD